MTNTMSLRIAAIPENEGFARSVVAGFCVCANPSLEVINDIKTAVSEAVTNCVVHGYENCEGDILIDGRICDNLLTVSIIDYGKGILNLDNAMSDYYTTKENEERSGLGFTIMKTFMDSLKVSSVVGAGTTVTMTKSLDA